jgi:predicted Zn-dependent protease
MARAACQNRLTGLVDFEGVLERALGKLSRTVAFAEVLAEQGSGEYLNMDTRSTTFGTRPNLRGAVFRIWTGKRWSEAATSQLDDRGLEGALSTLRSSEGKASGSRPVPGSSSTTRGEQATKPEKPTRDLGAEGLIRLGRDAIRWAQVDPSIREVNAAIAWEGNERLYLNSVGARCWQRIERTRGAVVPIAIEGGRVEVEFLSEGGIGGQERLAHMVEARVAETARDSVALLHAKAPPSGETDVILDPSVAGLFAHESFGHGTEADQFLRNRSYLAPLVGSTLAKENVTIVDDGSYPAAWGTIYFDDEGHPGQRTVLVDHGKFIGALHDRETAGALGTKPTGNTRRSDFLSRAFVRMTNTFVEPGDRTLEELVKEVPSGVLLEHGSSGIEDPLGGQMQLKVQRGRKIENGKLTDLVTSMALSGKVLDVLKSIRGVSRKQDFEMNPGFCGKGHGDLIPAGTGGVYVLTRAIVGSA